MMLDKSQMKEKTIFSQQDVVNKSDFDALHKDHDETLKQLTLLKS